MKKTVTMSDIGKRMGVSTVTVSKALADKEGVSEEIRKKIKDLAIEMGYKANTPAKSDNNHKDKETNNIGIIIPDRFVEVGVSYYWELYKIIADTLIKENYYAIFEIIKHQDEKEGILPKLINDKKVDGVILLGQVGKKYFNMIKQVSVPVVFMDFYEEDINEDFVISDSFYGAFMLTNHLIEMGHRKIGFIGNIRATSSIQDRFLGYLKAMIANGIDYRKGLSMVIDDRDDDGDLIDFVLPEDLATAYVCNCDSIAYELIEKLVKSGYKVPEDISVVGFDNYLRPTERSIELTTAEVDMKAMAQMGVDTLIKRIHHSKTKKGIRQVGCKLVFKNSVRQLI